MEIITDIMSRPEVTAFWDMTANLLSQGNEQLQAVTLRSVVTATTLGLSSALICAEVAKQVTRGKTKLRHVDNDLLQDWPILGVSPSFDTNPEQFWQQVTAIWIKTRERYPNDHYIFAMFGPKRVVFALTPEAMEPIMRSQTQIRKGFFYSFLTPWLRTGLLTAWGAKWKTRRRLLTPAFHKNVLGDFVEVMNEKAQIMLGIIDDELKSNSGCANMQWIITLCALDIICETAMGASMNTQSDRTNPYALAVYDLMEAVQKRQKYVWLWPDFIFGKTKTGKRTAVALEIVQDFTRKVIKDRWEEFQDLKRQNKLESWDDIFPGQGNKSTRRRLAFLDTLFHTMDKDQSIDFQGIAEEVDTFMFEGHDTTATAMLWALQEIGNDETVNRQVNEEIEQVFGDSQRPATIDDLNKLEYLEACIKEALRKFPSVPVLSREMDQDQEVNNGGENKTIIPKGSLVLMSPYMVHRQEQSWKDPLTFKPERFLPGGESENRHPYSYVPFSAGSRNCIGQRFAILEEKVILSTLLRNFEIQSTRVTNEIPVIAEIITRPKDGLTLKMTRKTN